MPEGLGRPCGSRRRDEGPDAANMSAWGGQQPAQEGRSLRMVGRRSDDECGRPQVLELRSDAPSEASRHGGRGFAGGDAGQDLVELGGQSWNAGADRMPGTTP